MTSPEQIHVPFGQPTDVGEIWGLVRLERTLGPARSEVSCRRYEGAGPRWSAPFRIQVTRIQSRERDVIAADEESAMRKAQDERELTATSSRSEDRSTWAFVRQPREVLL